MNKGMLGRSAMVGAELSTAGNRVEVTANVDTSPSPSFVLQRTIEEASQIFGPTRRDTRRVFSPSNGGTVVEAGGR